MTYVSYVVHIRGAMIVIVILLSNSVYVKKHKKTLIKSKERQCFLKTDSHTFEINYYKREISMVK